MENKMTSNTINSRQTKSKEFNPSENSIILTFLVTKVETSYVPQVTAISTKETGMINNNTLKASISYERATEAWLTEINSGQEIKYRLPDNFDVKENHTIVSALHFVTDDLFFFEFHKNLNTGILRHDNSGFLNNETIELVKTIKREFTLSYIPLIGLLYNYRLQNTHKTVQTKLNYCNNVFYNIKTSLLISLGTAAISMVLMMILGSFTIGITTYLALALINCIVFKFGKKHRISLNNIIDIIEEQIAPYKEVFSKESESINNNIKTQDQVSQMTPPKNDQNATIEQQPSNRDLSPPISLTIASIILKTTKHNLENLMNFYNNSWETLSDQSYIFDRNNEYFSKITDEAIEDATKSHKKSKKDKESGGNNS